MLRVTALSTLLAIGLMSWLPASAGVVCDGGSWSSMSVVDDDEEDLFVVPLITEPMQN